MFNFKAITKRRIVAELLIINKFKSFKECAQACEELALELGTDYTFNPLLIQHYVACHRNLGIPRLRILAKLLGVTHYSVIDEVFVCKERYVGNHWIGDQGNYIKDLDIRDLKLPKVE